MFTHRNRNAEPHQHATVADARECEEALNAPEVHDEDGQIAMMRVLETDEAQRMETEQEEQMVLSLGIVPNHREMTGLQLIHYREACDLRKPPARGKRLHHIDEACNCPNSYARCHLFQNCKQTEEI